MPVAAPEPAETMGQPEPRLDAVAKVTGEARYAADVMPRNCAQAWLVTSAIARGTVIAIDDRASWAVPGVLAIMTSDDTQLSGEFVFFGKGGSAATSRKPLASRRVWHDGDIVAMI